MTAITYAIDVRIFLLSITTVMAIAFGVGIAFSPDLHSIIEAASTSSSSSTSTSTPSPPQPPKNNTLNEHHVNYETPSFEHLGSGTITYENKTDGSGSNTTLDSERLPAGQHLLMDMKNLEADFLNSEERLANAMVKTVQGAGLILLSYHCHSFMPAGVSCVCILLESHISFHTWPEEGVITLDLFTCGSNPLLPVVSTMEKLFGIPLKKADSEEDDEYEEVITLWSHELR